MRLPGNIFADRRLSWLSIGLAVAIVTNVGLAAAYVWSRGGQTTQIRMEARDTTFRVELDGRLVTSTIFDAPPSGGIRVTIEDTNIVPSLPQPRGIDRVRVTSLDDGTILLDENFSSWRADNGGLQVTQGEAKVRNGVLGSEKGNVALQIDDPEWRNILVDVTFRNITTAGVSVRVPGRRIACRIQFPAVSTSR